MNPASENSGPVPAEHLDIIRYECQRKSNDRVRRALSVKMCGSTFAKALAGERVSQRVRESLIEYAQGVGG